MKRIYVGNLPFSATEDQVRDVFAPHGTVHSVSLVTDRYTGQPRGFAFVEMDDTEAQGAISAANGFDMGGRSLTVDEAKPRPSGGGGGGRPRDRW